MFRFIQGIFTLVLAVNYSLAQNTTEVKKDTLPQNVLQLAPHYLLPVAHVGSYIKVISDSNLFKFNQGLNIFNLFRGRVPGLVISPYAVLSAPRFRSAFYDEQSATVLIDGVPYNSAIRGYLNMNAWEYSSITASPSPNVFAFLDLPNAGVISLQSKSGEGYSKPTVEFNSTPIMGMRDLLIRSTSGPSNTIRYEDWHLNNAIAFMQDYGLLDMRVSYNLLKSWVTPSEVLVKKPMQHNLNLNLGYKLGSRGEVRLITGGTLKPQADSYISLGSTFPPIPADTGRIESSLGFFNANLVVKYSFTDWLSLKAQTVISAQDSSYTKQSSAFPSRTMEKQDGQKRASVYVSASKMVFKDFHASSFAGFQFSSMSTNRLGTFGQNSAEFKQTFKRSYFSAGTTMIYRDWVSATALVKLPVSKDDYANYSASTSASLTKFLKWRPLSLAKVRGTVGKNHFMDYSSYPYQRVRFSVARTTPIRSIEFGADVGFWKNRLELYASWYKDSWPSGFSIEPEFKQKGFEAILAYNLIQRTNSMLKPQLVMARINNKDFRGSFLLDYTYKNLFVSVMVERISLESTFPAQSFTRMRDATVGISLHPTWLSRLKISSINISFSARNFYDFEGEGLNDFESFSFAKSYMGSIGINI